MSNDNNKMKILFISLGCDKNLVDSEEMLGLLNREHFESQMMKVRLM